MSKTKISEPEIEMVETGTIELSVKMKTLRRETALSVERDIRRALQNCASLKQLDEFVVTRTVEYAEVPVGRAN